MAETATSETGQPLIPAPYAGQSRGVVAYPDEARGQPDPFATKPDFGSLDLPQVDAKGAVDALTGVQKERIEKTDELNSLWSKRLDQTQQRMDRALNATEYAAHSIPPNWNEIKESDRFIRGPWELFGQPATLFAMIASGFSRQPMLTAMNAAAAAINAGHSGDVEAYNRAHEAWKQNTELAIKRFDMENKVFQETEHLFNTDMKAWETNLAINAAKYDNKKVLTLLQHGMSAEVFKLMEDQAKASDQMRISLEEGDRFKAKFQGMEELWDQMSREHGRGSEDPWNAGQIGQAMDLKRQTYNAKNETERQQAQLTLQHFMQNGRMPNAEESARINEAAHPATLIRRDIAQIQEAGRDRRLVTTEAGKTERLATTEAGKDSRLATTEAGKLERAQLSAGTRMQLAQLSAGTRKEIAEMTEGGRNARAALSDSAKRDIAKMNVEARRELSNTLARQEGQWVSDRTQQLMQEHGDNPAYNVVDARAQALKEQSERRASARAESQGAGKEDIKNLADGIISGITPPSLVGFYRQKAPTEAELSRRGFDLSKAMLEWDKAHRQIATLNGPQMTRFAGLATSVVNTIDEVKNLASEMRLGGIPALNYLELQNYIQLHGNSKNGQLAAKYIGAVNTLKEEFANLAQGGYAPTESVWHLANRQINENYGVKELGASLDEVQRLIRYRVQAVPGLSTLGPGGENRYTGKMTPATAPASTGGRIIKNGGNLFEVQPDGSKKYIGPADGR